MLTFFTDCVGLFAGTFNAAMGIEFFRFLVLVFILQISFGLFFYIYRGSKKF